MQNELTCMLYTVLVKPSPSGTNAAKQIKNIWTVRKGFMVLDANLEICCHL